MRETVVVRDGVCCHLGADAWNNLANLNLGVSIDTLNHLLQLLILGTLVVKGAGRDITSQYAVA